MKKYILAAISYLCVAQTAVAHNRIIVPVQPKTQTSIQQFAKNTLQNAAGLTAIGALGYGGYQLAQSIRYWWQSSENNPEASNKSNISMAKFLFALLIAASAGTLATADLSTVNFNIHFDIVRALELLFKSGSSKQ